MYAMLLFMKKGKRQKTQAHGHEETIRRGCRSHKNGGARDTCDSAVLSVPGGSGDGKSSNDGSDTQGQEFIGDPQEKESALVPFCYRMLSGGGVREDGRRTSIIMEGLATITLILLARGRLPERVNPAMTVATLRGGRLADPQHES